MLDSKNSNGIFQFSLIAGKNTNPTTKGKSIVFNTQNLTPPCRKTIYNPVNVNHTTYHAGNGTFTTSILNTYDSRESLSFVPLGERYSNYIFLASYEETTYLPSILFWPILQTIDALNGLV